MNQSYVKIISTIFDALILPVASYGCQSWLPHTWYFRNFLHRAKESNLSIIARDPIEKLYLTFLKWTIGVNRKTSNAAVWGDTGRYPLASELSKQVFNYFDRLNKMDKDNSESLIRHAFHEQKQLQLKWYCRITHVRELAQNRADSPIYYPSQARSQIRKEFEKRGEEEMKKVEAELRARGNRLRDQGEDQCTEMINMACQDVVEGTESEDFVKNFSFLPAI